MNLSLLTFNFHDSFLPMLLNALSTIIGTSPTYPWSFICCCWFTLSKSSVYFWHSVILRRFCVCTLSNNVSMTLSLFYFCQVLAHSSCSNSWIGTTRQSETTTFFFRSYVYWVSREFSRFSHQLQMILQFCAHSTTTACPFLMWCPMMCLT